MLRFYSRRLALFFLALSLVACTKRAVECRQLSGLGGKIQVALPSGWEEMPDLHESADIKAGSQEADAYLVVVSERKSALPSETLEEYSQFTRDGLVRSMTFPQQLGPRRQRVAGMQAVQYEIHAIGKFGSRLVELHTAIESPEYFHQVVLWTSAERFPANEAAMKAIVESFREL